MVDTCTLLRPCTELLAFNSSIWYEEGIVRFGEYLVLQSLD
jgi:hypothetical protein